ncbi:MAG TPA: hemerythrin family protein [Rhodocyclaceae bacterium]
MDSEKIEWSPALAIGNPTIDRQHEKLFQVAADMVEDRDQMRAMRTLASLSEYVVVHFRDEEKMLEQAGYPGLAEHRKLHEAFRIRLAKLYSNAAGMTLDDIAAQVRVLINEWLANHIMVVDREYAKYLAEKRGA